MNDLFLKLWLGFGIFCLIGEFLLPGLVIVFIGLAALTVALGMQLGYIHSILEQLITFFISSIFYLITIRFLVLRLLPTDTKKVNINEDDAVIGSIVEVSTEIIPGKVGRIIHSDSTWQAKSECNETILAGEKVKIISRDNITWIVQKI
jgi:inner membrane protein